jgi:hypothetical protein
MAKATLHTAWMVEKNPSELTAKCQRGHSSDGVLCGCAGPADRCAATIEKSGVKPNPCPELKQIVVDELPTDLPIRQQEILMLLEALNAELGDLLAC